MNVHSYETTGGKELILEFLNTLRTEEKQKDSTFWINLKMVISMI